MARGLSSDVKTELATGNINPVHLVHFNFATPLYITDCGYDLTSSISGTSRTYTASGHLLGISGVAEGTEPIKNTLSIVLSGVDQSYISVALNENIINSSVQIYRALLNSSNAIISDPFFSETALTIFMKLCTMLDNDKRKKVTKPDYPKKFWIIQKVQKCGQNDSFSTFSQKWL